METNNENYHITKFKPKKLGEFINSFMIYHFKGDTPVMLNPLGNFELIFQLNGNFLQNSTATDHWQHRPQYFIGGLHNRSFRIKPSQKESKLISVNFKPHCARFFIPDRLNLYKNKLVNLRDIFHRSEILDLEAIQNDNPENMNLDLLESFLRQIYRDRSVSPIDYALTTIFRDNGFTHIGNLARSTCLSNSQLRKRFNEEVGMSPKEYSKIVRINYISGLLAKAPPTKLTELTYQLGYFDQAHFIKDFKSVTGSSPKNYLNPGISQ